MMTMTTNELFLMKRGEGTTPYDSAFGGFLFPFPLLFFFFGFGIYPIYSDIWILYIATRNGYWSRVVLI